MSQACAGGPLGTDQWLESVRWVGVAGSRAISLSDPTARGETVLLHMLRGERKELQLKKIFFQI